MLFACSKLYLNYFWIVPDLSLNYPWSLFELSLNCFRNVPKLSLNFPWFILKMSKNSPQIVLRQKEVQNHLGRKKKIQFPIKSVSMYSFFFTFCSVSGHHAPLNLLWSGEKGEEGKTQGAQEDIDLKYTYSRTSFRNGLDTDFLKIWN